MSPLWRSLEDAATNRRTLFAGTSFGPVEVDRQSDHVTVAGPSGTVRVDVPVHGARSEVADLVAAGVPIVVDGTVAGRAVQDGHGLAQSERTLDLAWEADWQAATGWPDGVRLRATGSLGTVRMDGADGVLVEVPRPHTVNANRRLAVAEGLDPRLVLVYVALRQALSSVLHL